MQYKFKNRTILEVLEKFVIAATNLLIHYLIVKVSYTNFLLIIKLIILGIEFKVFKEISFANNKIAKFRKKKPD